MTTTMTTTTATPAKETARVRLYVGTQQVGKTTLALTHAYESPRIPLLIDPRGTLLSSTGPLVGGRVRRWELPVAASVDHVRDLVYRGARTGCVFMPRTEAEFRRVCAGALTERTGKILFYIDEWSLLCTQKKVPKPLADGIRTCAHINVEFLVTTQCPQDIESRIRNCINEVYALKTPDTNAQEVLRQ